MAVKLAPTVGVFISGWGQNLIFFEFFIYFGAQKIKNDYF
jgi:hypothetical protein